MASIDKKRIEKIIFLNYKMHSFMSPLKNDIRQEPRNESSHVITFKKVMEELKENYNFENSITSTSLDILALYLKGQKILHIESKTLCEKRLNSLMLPAIFISSLCSVLNFVLKNVIYGDVVISALNVLNAFLMSTLSYLKLDAKAEAHKISAYKYQKLESYCEFNSGRILFFDEKDQSISELVRDIQSKVMEIKESNQFVLPESVRIRFKDIFSTNVFTLVKDIQNDEIVVINKLKIIIQKMQLNKRERREENDLLIESVSHYDDYINNQIEKEIEKMKQDNIDTELKINYEKIRDDVIKNEMTCKTLKQNIETKTRHILKLEHDFEILEQERVKSFEDAIKHRKKYLELSNKFDKELSRDRDKQKHRYDICNWLKT